MSGPAYPSAPLPAPDAADTTARRLAMVERLAEIGMELAEGLLVQARQADGRVEACGEIALAYSRIARAVRLTVMLAERVEADAAQAPVQAGHEPDAAAREAMVQRVKARMAVLVRKDEVRQVAGAAIAAEARERGEGLDAERLLADLDRRIDSSEIEEIDWRDRPLGELAARVCADLGVAYDPRLWEDAGPATAGNSAEGATAPTRPTRGRAPPPWMAARPPFDNERRPP